MLGGAELSPQGRWSSFLPGSLASPGEWEAGSCSGTQAGPLPGPGPLCRDERTERAAPSWGARELWRSPLLLPQGLSLAWFPLQPFPAAYTSCRVMPGESPRHLAEARGVTPPSSMGEAWPGAVCQRCTKLRVPAGLRGAAELVPVHHGGCCRRSPAKYPLGRTPLAGTEAGRWLMQGLGGGMFGTAGGVGPETSLPPSPGTPAGIFCSDTGGPSQACSEGFQPTPVWPPF